MGLATSKASLAQADNPHVSPEIIFVENTGHQLFVKQVYPRNSVGDPINLDGLDKVTNFPFMTLTDI